MDSIRERERSALITMKSSFVRDDNDPAAGMKAGKTDTGFDVEGFVAGGVIGQN